MAMHFWVNSEVEDYFDDFTIEEGSIKRSIRMDLVNEEYYSVLEMGGGVLLGAEAINGNLTGNVTESNMQPFATIEAFQRNEVGEDESFGKIVCCDDGKMRYLGNYQSLSDTVVSMLRLTIRVQKFLEEEGVIDSDPEKDGEDVNVYVYVDDDDEIVGKIITDTSGFELVTYKE